MKSIRHIALSIILTFGVFGVVLYTSCSKSGCDSVTCLHECSCSGGICTGAPKGIGGNSCEIEYRKLYEGTYRGSAAYSSSIAADTTFIPYADTGNTLVFMSGMDSVYERMRVVWNRPGKSSVIMDITLANNTASGSTFTFEAPPVDTFTYTGRGSVTGTTASMNLIEAHPNSPSTVVTLGNFINNR